MKNKSLGIVVIAVLVLTGVAFYYNWGSAGESKLLQKQLTNQCDQSEGCNDECYASGTMADYVKIGEYILQPSTNELTVTNLPIQNIEEVRLYNKGAGKYSIDNINFYMTPGGYYYDDISNNSIRCKGTFFGRTLPQQYWTSTMTSFVLEDLSVYSTTTLEIWGKPHGQNANSTAGQGALSSQNTQGSQQDGVGGIGVQRKTDQPGQ